jgi:hypothetical protein
MTMQKKTVKMNDATEKTTFLELFGNSPTNKVLDFLISYQAFDYPLTEISKNSGVAYSTLQIIWPFFIKNNLGTNTRRVGKSNLFKLNTSHPAIKQAIAIDWNLI